MDTKSTGISFVNILDATAAPMEPVPEIVLALKIMSSRYNYVL